MQLNATTCHVTLFLFVSFYWCQSAAIQGDLLDSSRSKSHRGDLDVFHENICVELEKKPVDMYHSISSATGSPWFQLFEIFSYFFVVCVWVEEKYEAPTVDITWTGAQRENMSLFRSNLFQKFQNKLIHFLKTI